MTLCLCNMHFNCESRCLKGTQRLHVEGISMAILQKRQGQARCVKGVCIGESLVHHCISLSSQSTCCRLFRRNYGRKCPGSREEAFRDSGTAESSATYRDMPTRVICGLQYFAICTKTVVQCSWGLQCPRLPEAITR